MDDKELLNQSTETASLSSESSLLQENSDNLKVLAGKFSTTSSQVTSDLKPTELYKIQVRQKLDFLDKELNAMKDRGDFGIANLDDKGVALEGDMEFIGKKGVIPEELKEENS